MCKNIQSEINGELFLVCEKTGKEISVSNDSGMYCEDLCGMDEDENSQASLIDLIKSRFSSI